MNGIGSRLTTTVSTALAELTPLPRELIKIIGGYAEHIDFSPLGIGRLRFNFRGEIQNPGLRALYKESFLSSYCSADLKTAILERYFCKTKEYVCLEEINARNEIIKIFEEIVQAGDRLCLDGITPFNVKLSELNFSNVSMRAAEFSHSLLFRVDLCGADLTDTVFRHCFLFQDFSKTTMTGTNLDTSKLMPAFLDVSPSTASTAVANVPDVSIAR